jgi:hypothetical protein
LLSKTGSGLSGLAARKKPAEADNPPAPVRHNPDSADDSRAVRGDLFSEQQGRRAVGPSALDDRPISSSYHQHQETRRVPDPDDRPIGTRGGTSWTFGEPDPVPPRVMTHSNDRMSFAQQRQLKLEREKQEKLERERQERLERERLERERLERERYARQHPYSTRGSAMGAPPATLLDDGPFGAPRSPPIRQQPQDRYRSEPFGGHYGNNYNQYHGGNQYQQPGNANPYRDAFSFDMPNYGHREPSVAVHNSVTDWRYASQYSQPPRYRDDYYDGSVRSPRRYPERGPRVSVNLEMLRPPPNNAPHSGTSLWFFFLLPFVFFAWWYVSARWGLSQELSW